MANLINYSVRVHSDVWGNEEDGWTVNNGFNFGNIQLSDDGGNTEVIQALIDAELLMSDVQPDQISIDWNSPEHCDIDRTHDGCPLFSLDRDENAPEFEEAP